MDRRHLPDALPLRSYLVGRLVLGTGVALLLVPLGAPSAFTATILAATSLVGWQMYRRRARERLSLTGLLLTDLLLETYVILETGGHDSPFVLLFGFTVLCAGLLLALEGGLVFGALTASASFGLAWLTPQPDLALPGAGTWPEPVARFTLQAVFLVALGLASGSLAAVSRRRERQWAETDRRLQQTEMEAETILVHLPWGVLTLDAGGRIRHLNRAAVEILGLRGRNGGALWPRTLEDLESCGGGALAQAARSVLRQGRRIWCHEAQIMPAQSPADPRPVELVAAPIGDRGEDDLGGVVVLFQDLTERKRLEFQARSQDRLAALGRFSAGLAHEIRNSLKPISGSAELLALMPLAPDAAKLLDLILRESEALERFLETYLDYARDKDLQLEPLSIDALIREELEALRHHPASPAGVVWDLRVRGEPPVARVDREQLRRALRNVLINAMEATRRGVIRVTVEQRGISRVRIRVRDWGCGMTRETLENLFTPLYTTKADGTGLGLCYARRIAERHDGSLSVASRAGKGTLVTLDLPLAPDRAAAA